MTLRISTGWICEVIRVLIFVSYNQLRFVFVSVIRSLSDEIYCHNRLTGFYWDLLLGGGNVPLSDNVFVNITTTLKQSSENFSKNENFLLNIFTTFLLLNPLVLSKWGCLQKTRAQKVENWPSYELPKLNGPKIFESPTLKAHNSVNSHPFEL